MRPVTVSLETLRTHRLLTIAKFITGNALTNCTYWERAGEPTFRDVAPIAVLGAIGRNAYAVLTASEIEVAARNCQGQVAVECVQGRPDRALWWSQTGDGDDERITL